jgi:glycerate kinase
MRLLIAPQEFKGSLSAREAASAMADGLRRALPDAEIDVLPMADGGPGTVEALVEARAGRRLQNVVSDPLGRPVEAAWGLLEDDATAVIEMAAASGLVLLRREELDPRAASTYGTGQLIAAALDAGCRRIIVGVGGSATNDGGAGMAQALGARLLDDQGEELPAGGAALARLHRIDVSGLDSRIADCRVLVAVDVTNLLCGPTGASAVYGPQKGATPEIVGELDAALAHYAAVIERDLDVKVAELPGAGAAGGLPAGLVAFLGAEIRPGVDLIAEAAGLAERLARADVVLTGEGRLDAQTAYGKTVAGVARMAKERGLPVIALAGGVTGDTESLRKQGIDVAMSITPGPMALTEAEARAAELLSAAAERVGRLLALGRGLAPAG